MRTLHPSHTDHGHIGLLHKASISSSVQSEWKSANISGVNSKHCTDARHCMCELYLEMCYSIAGPSQPWNSLQTSSFYLTEQHHSLLELGSSQQPRPQSQDSSLRCVFLLFKNALHCPSSTEWSQTTLRGNMLFWSSHGYKLSGSRRLRTLWSLRPHPAQTENFKSDIFFKNSFQKCLFSPGFCLPMQTHSPEHISITHLGGYRSHRCQDRHRYMRHVCVCIYRRAHTHYTEEL